MKILALSGWGQPHDALAGAAPQAEHWDYANHTLSFSSPACGGGQVEGKVPHVQAYPASRSHPPGPPQAGGEACLAALAEKNCDLAVGWSLGGQLLVRAIAAGRFQAKKLVLIAAPFQFVATSASPVGMKPDLYATFRGNYARQPERTLRKAWELIAKGDSCAPQVMARLRKQDMDAMLEKDWLHWLDTLEGFSCAGLDFGHFPPTLLIHGEGDAVVSPVQAECFAKYIPNLHLILMPDTGHAPHWHDERAVAGWIQEFAHVR